MKGFAKRLGKEVIEINESIGLVNPALSLINEAAYMLTRVSIPALKSSSDSSMAGPEMADRLGLDLVLN